MRLPRHGFFEHCRKHLPGILVAFNVADFKRYNDALGHRVGEDAIATFERILGSELKPAQAFARVEGGCWLALLDANGAVETLTRILEAFAKTIERQIGWSASARSGPNTAHATEATASSIHRAMRCLYAPVSSLLELEQIGTTLIDRCHGFPPSVPIALHDLDLQDERPWRSVNDYPSASFYCPLCRGTTFDWTDGDASMYGAEGRCRTCRAELSFRNLAGPF